MRAPIRRRHFYPPSSCDESPRDRVARLEQSRRNGTRVIASAGDNAVFTVFLFNNNIRVSVLAFAAVDHLRHRHVDCSVL